MNWNLVILAVAVLISHMISQNMANIWGCIPCTPEECEKQPNKPCPWGEGRDRCNRRVCLQGPGERCGGRHDIHGECGGELMCKTDERCYGCIAQTMDCYPQTRI